MIFNHFPFEKPRPGTKDAIEKIEAAFNAGKKFVFVHAPTGSGKSSISVSVARHYKATIWTPTKLLQEQYANTPEFTFEYVIKGKASYKCGLPGQGDYAVDEAICCSSKIVDENRGLIPFPLGSDKKGLSKEVKLKCADQGICPYYTKIYNISKIPGAVMNYDLGLRIKKFPGRHGGSELGDTVILDEAHQILSKINSVFGTKVTNTGAMRLFGNQAKRGKGEDPIVWFNRLATMASEKIAKESDGKKVAKFQNFEKKISSLLEQDIENEKKFFIDDKGSEVEIKPLDVRYLKAQIFFPFKRVLLLSATFPPNIKQVLGISDEESEDIRIESNFPLQKRRAVFPRDIANVNKATVLNPGSDQIVMLNLILDAHKDDKGIIHCGNYKFFDQLQSLYKHNKRFLWVTQDKDKDDMLDMHASSKEPTILVSPAMLEGVDLKGDLARFGVLLKVPYPALDDYTKRMSKIFPSWYENLTITNIVQAYGRQVRSEDDFANFYIIDGAFKMLLNRNQDLISPYLLQALKVGDVSKMAAVLKKKAAAKK